MKLTDAELDELLRLAKYVSNTLKADNWNNSEQQIITKYLCKYVKENPERITRLVACVKELREHLDDVTEHIDTGQRDCIKAPEDEEIKELCERLGYGAVMDSAARQWRKKYPNSACTEGPCVYVVKQARQALAKWFEVSDENK